MQDHYNEFNITPSLAFASHLYDQVWAFALALNNSLSELKNRNLSIDNYTIGQAKITEVIEGHMANLSFQGAGDFIKFDRYHGVSTPIEVFWVSDSLTEKWVGSYNPLHSSVFFVDINTSDLPEDSLPKVFKLILIPLPVAILLYILAVAVIIFITVQLFLYLQYRDSKAIKATSPYLSLLMFAGCYLVCLSAIAIVTSNSFLIAPRTFTILLHNNIFIIVNGFSLILVTLFIKLLRVYRIFFSRLKIDLGNCWSNFPLLLIVVVFCILLNIIPAFIIIFETPEYHSYTQKVRKGSTIIIEKHIFPRTKNNFLTECLVFGFFLLFLLLICFLAIRTRKIRYNNFKDTKKINIFIVALVLILSFTIPLYIILVNLQNEPAANISLITGILFIPLASQLILFLPKILPAVCEKYFPKGLNGIAA